MNTAVRSFQVTFDCAEPERVARFWCEVLGYSLVPPEPEDPSCAAVDPQGHGPRLYFQPVPESKVAKNRLHLDVRVGSELVGEHRLSVLEQECRRLLELGARRGTLLLADGVNESCQVMQDVEGNEFCLD